ncbi:MAG: hypothetical protein IJ366_06345 [Clostridia bacterium]|nr:hypothetical protein [Clostridia bacterium]
MNRIFKAVILVPLLICALLAAIIFLNGKSTEAPPPAHNAPTPQTVFGETEAEPLEEYMLIAEKGYLNLYQKGDSSAPKHSERLDPSLLPASDIKELENGMSFSSAEEAYRAMESFIN